MIRRPPRSTRTDTLFPYTTLFLSWDLAKYRGLAARDPVTIAAVLFRDFRRRRDDCTVVVVRSEEHTSELQSLMRISYAVFCLKKKKHNNKTYTIIRITNISDTKKQK